MNADRTIIKSFEIFLPVVKNWIGSLLDEYSSKAKSVSSFNFPNLPSYYSKEILNIAKVVVIDKVPTIPLSSFGLSQFRDFENMEVGGITYIDSYFIRSDHVGLESVHFHELVHIIQWKHLGIDKFLLFYGLGLLKHGYWDSPLEVLVRNLEEYFKKGDTSIKVENKVIKFLDEMTADLF